MGFSSALQGRAAHDALLARQDAELRLLDTMKRCLLQKAKCDKDYATALTAVTQQGMKIDRTDECQGSHIIRAWRTIMDEIEQTAKQFKSNSELLDNICQEKLAQLYQEKRKARKAYQEEHCRIASQFTQLTEEVARKKTDYQKHMEYYKLLRARFEEHYIKSGRGGRKLDDVRDKYQKACRKLHLAHNEYVLLINEAVEVERDFRTCLLPGLLEHQQTLQEGFIQTWRNILQDAAQCGDITSDKFREYQKRIESAIQSVNPSEEYKEFTEKHKTTPTAPTIFQFDETLIEDTLGKLQPNTLTVDNLTVDWLRNRLSELETQVKECQEKQSKISTDAGTPTLTRLNGGTNGCLKDDNKNTKDLNALRCQERQMQRLAEIIKSALNEVGCEELPSGCDDLSVEQNFIENNVVVDQSNIPSTSSYILQKGAEVMSMFKAPFRRKSGGGIPVTPEVSPKKERQKSPNRSLGSSVNSLESSSSFSKLEPNLYVDIDNAETNSLILMCENNLNILMEINNPDFISNGHNNETRVCSNNNKSSTDCIEKSSNSIGDSKNNLLLCNETNRNGVDIMKSSIDIHLDNIDKINKKLDEKMAQEAEISRTNTNSDFLQASKNGSSSNPFDKKDQSFKNKIRQKIKSTSNTINNNSNSSDKNKLIDNNNVSMEQENNATEIPLKNVIDKSPNSLENQIKDLEKLIEVTDKEIKKKSNTKIKRKKKKKSNNSEKLIEDDASAQEEAGGCGITVTDTDKKSKSFSNRSYNAIISSFRDIKNYNKSTNIESVKLTNAKDEHNEEMQDENNELIDVTNANIELKSETVVSTVTNDNNLETKNTAELSDEDFDNVSPPIKLDFAIELDEEGNIVSSSKIDQNELPSAQISKSRTTKFKENLKTKLKFNLKFNKSNKKQFCKICTKRFKKNHPSQKGFDFEREFHTENLFEFDSNEFCTCGDDSGDDFLTIKNHKYCDPDVVSKMQKIICMMCS